MPEIDIGDAVMAGVRLVMRQPVSVLCWGLLMAVFVGLLTLLFGGGVLAAISSLIQQGSNPNPAVIFGLVGSAFGYIFLLIIGVQMLDLVFRAAAMRAELEPEAHGFAYMRFGAQELWLLAASLIFWLVMLGANIAMSIPLGIVGVASAVGAAASASQGTANVGALAGLGIVRIVGQLIIAGVLIWLWLRLCLGVVASFHERQFRLFESWTMTRGHVLRMFLAMLLVGLILAAIYIVLWTIGFVTIGVTIVSAAGPDPKAFFSRPPADWVGLLTPLFIVVLVGIVITVGVGNALIWGTVSRMWKQLNPEADAAKAFT